MNILVIDDEKDIRDSISSILIRKGYSPTTIGNVVEAEDLIRNKKWNAIISDVMIPHAGGFELVDVVKQVSPQTPVILITGMEKKVLEATISGADIILTKPFTSKQLTDAVDNLVQLPVE